MILTLLHKSGRISLNSGPIWKIQKLTGSWEQARPEGWTESITCPPITQARRLGRLGRETGSICNSDIPVFMIGFDVIP